MKYIIIFLISLPTWLQGQSVEALFKKAVKQNAELSSLNFEYEAALQKANQVNELPNPQISAGIPILQTETRVGSQVFSVGASQMLPWFGTLKAKEDVVLTMAKSKYERLEMLKLDLYYKIKMPYVKLIEIIAKQAIVKENIRLYESLSQVSLSRVESGRGMASDVLLVKLNIQELENDILLLENQKMGLYAQINEVLNRESNIRIVIERESLSTAKFDIDKLVIRNKIEKHHPKIKQLEWLIETSKKEQVLIGLKRKPQFGIGLDYTWIQKRSDVNPSDNGKDILIPKASVSIPIFTKKYDAQHKEEAFNQLAIQSKGKAIVNQLMFQLEQYEVIYQEAVMNMDLYKKQVIITQSAIGILLSNYSTNGTRFDEILNLQTKLLKYQLLETEAMYQTQIAKIGLEYITQF